MSGLQKYTFRWPMAERNYDKLKVLLPPWPVSWIILPAIENNLFCTLVHPQQIFLPKVFAWTSKPLHKPKQKVNRKSHSLTYQKLTLQTLENHTYTQTHTQGLYLEVTCEFCSDQKISGTSDLPSRVWLECWRLYVRYAVLSPFISSRSSFFLMLFQFIKGKKEILRQRIIRMESMLTIGKGLAAKLKVNDQRNVWFCELSGYTVVPIRWPCSTLTADRVNVFSDPALIALLSAAETARFHTNQY